MRTLPPSGRRERPARDPPSSTSSPSPPKAAAVLQMVRRARRVGTTGKYSLRATQIQRQVALNESLRKGRHRSLRLHHTYTLIYFIRGQMLQANAAQIRARRTPFRTNHEKIEGWSAKPNTQKKTKIIHSDSNLGVRTSQSHPTSPIRAGVVACEHPPNPTVADGATEHSRRGSGHQG